MISAIFIHFQAIISKSSLTAGIFVTALSNPFFKSKIANYIWRDIMKAVTFYF